MTVKLYCVKMKGSTQSYYADVSKCFLLFTYFKRQVLCAFHKNCMTCKFSRLQKWSKIWITGCHYVINKLTLCVNAILYLK